MSKKHGEDSKRKLKNNIINEASRKSLSVNDAPANALKRPLTIDNNYGRKKKKRRTTINSSGKQEESTEDNNTEKQSQNVNNTRKNSNTKSKSDKIDVNNPKNPIANTVKTNISNVIGKRKKKKIGNTSSIKKTSSKINGTESVESNKKEIESTSNIKKTPFKINGTESVEHNKKEIDNAGSIKKTPSKTIGTESVEHNKKEIGCKSSIRKTPSKIIETEIIEHNKKEIDSVKSIKKTPSKIIETEIIEHNKKEIDSVKSIKKTPSKINGTESVENNKNEIDSASSNKKTPSKLNENESVENSKIMNENEPTPSFMLLQIEKSCCFVEDIHKSSGKSSTSVVKSPAKTDNLNKTNTKKFEITNIENSKDDSVLNNDKSGTAMFDSFNNESIIVTDSSKNIDSSIITTKSSKNLKPSLVTELCENSNSNKVAELSIGSSSTEIEITKNIEASTEIEITKNIEASTEIEITKNIEASTEIEITKNIEASTEIEITKNIEASTVTDSFYHNDPIVIVVPNKIDANVNPKTNELTDQVGNNLIETIVLEDSNDSSDMYSVDKYDLQIMADCINGLRKIDATVFPHLIKLFAAKKFGFEQFEALCTVKIMEYMAERYNPGKLRSKMKSINNKEVSWLKKYAIVEKQIREMRSVQKVQSIALKSKTPYKPYIIHRTVGLQATITPKELNTKSNSTETSVDASPETIDITIDECDPVIDITDNSEFCGDNGPEEDDSDDVISFSEVPDIPATTKRALKDVSKTLNNMPSTSKTLTDMMPSTSKTLTDMMPSTSKTFTVVMPSTSKTLTFMMPSTSKTLTSMMPSTSKTLIDNMMPSTSKTLIDNMMPSTSKTLTDMMPSPSKIPENTILKKQVQSPSSSVITLSPVLLKNAVPAGVSINVKTNVITNNYSTIDLTSEGRSEISNGYTLKKSPIQTVQASGSPSKQLSTNVSSQVLPTSFIVRTTNTGAKGSTITHLNTPKQSHKPKSYVMKNGRLIPIASSSRQGQPCNVTYSTLQLPSPHNGTMRTVQTQHIRSVYPPVTSQHIGKLHPATSQHNGKLQPVPFGIPIVNKEHPAPLPPIPHQRSLPTWKKLPQSPKVTITRTTQNSRALVLSWNMPVMNKTYANVNSYQIFAYHELVNEPPRTELWKKIGDVNALPLPMACSLTQFKPGEKYHFAIRAVDSYHRTGPFSEPQHVFLS